MKRMHTKKEIESIAEEVSPGFDPSTIEAGNIPQDGVLGLDDENNIIKGNLDGKYVKVWDAATLSAMTTDEFWENTYRGAFVNGELFGLKNPIIYPAQYDSFGKRSFVLGRSDAGLLFGAIQGKNYLGTIIKFANESSAGEGFQIPLTPTYGTFSIGGKLFPNFPPAVAQDSKKYHFVLDNGTLKWQDGNGLYVHNLTFTDSTNATRYLSVITDSATPFEIVSGTGPTLVQCADASIVIVPDSGKSLPMYNNKSFHPKVYSLSFPSGSTSVEYTSYEISTLDQDEVKPL